MSKEILKTELSILKIIDTQKVILPDFMYAMNPNLLVNVTLKNGLKQQMKYSEVIKSQYTSVHGLSIDELIKTLERQKI